MRVTGRVAGFGRLLCLIAMIGPPALAADPPSSPAPAAEGAGHRDDGPPTADSGSRNYLLGPADVIEVSTLGQPDFTTKGRIGEDGTFRVPYLGAFPAANKTTDQLGDDIAKALRAGGFYANPIVKVEVDAYASRYVTVLGNILTPGLVPVDRAYRLSEILAKVGGFRDTAADYVIFRPRQGEERRITIRDVATGDLKDDPYVSPGDKIYSPQADLFYVSGQTKTPGAFPLLPNTTIRMAISRGGGVTDAGSIKRVTVTRGGKKLTHVDLDGPVAPGDVIVVGERLF